MALQPFVTAYEAQLIGTFEILALVPDEVSERAYADAHAIYSRFAPLIDEYDDYQAGWFVANEVLIGFSDPKFSVDDYDGAERELAKIASIVAPFRWSRAADGTVVFEKPPFGQAYRNHLQEEKQAQAARAKANAPASPQYERITTSGPDGAACLGLALGLLAAVAVIVVAAAVVLWAVRYLLAAF